MTPIVPAIADMRRQLTPVMTTGASLRRRLESTLCTKIVKSHGRRRSLRAIAACATSPYALPCATMNTLETSWDDALSWSAYLESVVDKRDVWLANLRRAKIGEAEAARLAALPAERRVLVLSEDWCGDAARSVPALAAAFEGVAQIDARYLPLDSHPGALTPELLTHGGRAIPMLLVGDERGTLLGAWGPRPAPLQALLRERLRSEGRPGADDESRAAFYAPIMAWYAKDGGVTALQEVLMLLERGGEPR